VYVISLVLLYIERSGKFLHFVTYEVFIVVTMKNVVSWDVTQCDSCKNRRLGERCPIHHQGDKNQRARKSVSSN
jgi:hypothetical protein